jgi:regulator of protease activity HflC (stomatin/prohibitin superfamily)
MISPGNVGVLVDLMGEKKGVEQKELSVGAHFIAPWKRVYVFPIFEINKSWHDFQFQTVEGMAMSADIGITFHLQPDCVPKIFTKYRTGMNEITNVFILNYLRDAINKAASHMKIEDLYGNGKQEFFSDVEKQVKTDLEPLGIIISRIYLIGRFHFPEGVIRALNAKIEANQRAQQRENELRESEAEAKKKIAQAEGNARCHILEVEAQSTAKLLNAEAESKANEMIALSITPELIKYEMIKNWDGKLPLVSGQHNSIIDLTKLIQ